MKTKSILGLVALLALVAMPNLMMATPSCSSATTYAGLIADNSTGCTIGGLLFYNFEFTPSATGTGLASVPTATQMTIADVINGTTGSPGPLDPSGQLLYGFDFNPNIGIAGMGSEDILISYDVLAPSAEITSAHIQMNGGAANGGTATVTETDTPCTGVTGSGITATPTGCSAPLTPSLQVTQPTGSLLQNYLNIGPYEFVSVTKDINVSGFGANSTADLTFVRDAFDLSQVPEPATVSYVLIGCLGLFAAARRRKRA